MNSPWFSSSLLSCCLAVVLLFSLWLGGTQDLAQHDVHGDIAAMFDVDTHGDDPVEQFGILTRHALAVFVPSTRNYRSVSAQLVLSNSAPPPDRPPIESV